MNNLILQHYVSNEFSIRFCPNLSLVAVARSSHSFTVWFEVTVILGDAGALC